MQFKRHKKIEIFVIHNSEENVNGALIKIEVDRSYCIIKIEVDRIREIS